MTVWVIVNETTGLLEKSLTDRKHQFLTKGAADASLRAKNKRRNSSEARRAREYAELNLSHVKFRDSDVWTVMTYDEYKTRFPQTKIVKSLMNPDGPDIVLDVNTPACCDPSTETYWSS